MKDKERKEDTVPKQPRVIYDPETGNVIKTLKETETGKLVMKNGSKIIFKKAEDAEPFTGYIDPNSDPRTQAK